MNNNEKDPLLDELEERIAEGPVMFTPDEEFLKRVAHFSLATNEIQWRNLRCGGGQRRRTSFRRKLRRSC